MAEKSESYVDAALAALAREARQASPRPGPDLLSRVLADAGSVAAGRGRADASAPPSRVGSRRGLADRLFGWTSGTVASIMIGLAVGLGVGLEVESLPVLDEAVEDIPLAAVAPSLMPLEGL